MLSRLDSALLDRVFQPLADRIGALTGGDQYDMALGSITAASFSLLGGVGAVVVGAPTPGSSAALIFALTAAATGLLLHLRVRFAHLAAALREGEEGDGASPIRAFAIPARTAVLLGAALASWVIWSVLARPEMPGWFAAPAVPLNAAFWLVTAALYFLGCRRPPPRRTARPAGAHR